jgi:uncharacterized protein YndB with AHSA1/START domain
MNSRSKSGLDPDLDLNFERIVPVMPEQLYRGWTDPDLLKKWFCPRPWLTTDCEIDLKPGGIFRTVMRGPNGEEGGGTGCYLEIIPHRKIVWTSALQPGYRPAPPVAPEQGFHFTAIIEFEAAPGGTIYRATVRHMRPEDAQAHARMGFEAGWNAALDQLLELLAP